MSLLTLTLAGITAEKLPGKVAKESAWCTACQTQHPISEFSMGRVNRDGTKEPYHMCKVAKNQGRRKCLWNKIDLQNQARLDDREVVQPCLSAQSISP